MLGNPIDWNCASCEKSKINFDRGRLYLAAKHTALHLTSIKAANFKGIFKNKGGIFIFFNNLSVFALEAKSLNKSGN
jgi:hypothetical protein